MKARPKLERPGVSRAPRSIRNSRGFTLAELVVATTLITIVMTAVYTAFGAATRTWRLAEANQGGFQEARIAWSTLSHELNCIVGGSEHLFEGEDDEFEFFAVTPPMNVEKGEGARLLWIRYRYNRPNHRLERQEALVKEPLPVKRPGEHKIDRGRIKLGTKYEFTMATNVEDFKVSYIWLPEIEREANEPPEYVEPIIMDHNKMDWGMPQGIKAEFAIKDPESPRKKTSFVGQTTFRITQPPYDEKRMMGKE